MLGPAAAAPTPWRDEADGERDMARELACEVASVFVARSVRERWAVGAGARVDPELVLCGAYDEERGGMSAPVPVPFAAVLPFGPPAPEKETECCPPALRPSPRPTPRLPDHSPPTAAPELALRGIPLPALAVATEAVDPWPALEAEPPACGLEREGRWRRAGEWGVWESFGGEATTDGPERDDREWRAGAGAVVAVIVGPLETGVEPSRARLAGAGGRVAPPGGAVRIPLSSIGSAESDAATFTPGRGRPRNEDGRTRARRPMVLLG